MSTAIATAPEENKRPDPYGGKTAAEFFAARLVPGTIPEGTAPGEWKPCGLAQGVLFFENVYGYDPETKQNSKLVKKGTEKEALRYLMHSGTSPDALECPHARKHLGECLEWRALHIGQLGLCEPSVDFLLTRQDEVMREMVAAFEEGGYPVGKKFITCKASINANQPAHATRWHVVKAEAGVWCVFYV